MHIRGGLNFKSRTRKSAGCYTLAQQQMPSEDLMTVALILQRVTTIRKTDCSRRAISQIIMPSLVYL